MGFGWIRGLVEQRRLARLARVLRAGVLLWRVSKDLRSVLRTNGLGYVLISAGVLVMAGAVVVWLVEPRIDSFGDAVWWSIVTATTVGYGDIAPVAPLGRVIAACLMFIGIGTIGMTTGSVATYFLNERDKPSNSEVAFIRERLDAWDELSLDEKKRLSAMFDSLVNTS